MFSEARSLFERYNAALLEARRAGHGPQFDSEYMIEAQQRLEQLAFIVDRVQALAKPSPASRLLALAKYESQLHAVPHLRDAKYADDMRGLRGHLEEVAAKYPAGRLRITLSTTESICRCTLLTMVIANVEFDMVIAILRTRLRSLSISARASSRSSGLRLSMPSTGDSVQPNLARPRAVLRKYFILLGLAPSVGSWPIAVAP